MSQLFCIYVLSFLKLVKNYFMNGLLRNFAHTFIKTQEDYRILSKILIKKIFIFIYLRSLKQFSSFLIS